MKQFFIRFTFLGGLGEIGMNSMLLQTPEGSVIIDCGVMFPYGRYFGPELILPDLRFFKQHMDDVKAIIITHGHEDHLGAVPYILNGRTDIPIYASLFAAGVLKERLLEVKGKAKVPIVRIVPGTVINAAGLEFEFLSVTHSIPDSTSLVIRSPIGTIVHTGDFKVDSTPVEGEPFDWNVFAKLGDEGVHLLLSDSTNVERPGQSKPEQWVASNIADLVSKWPGRVIITLFASNIHRIALLIKLAKQLKRKPFLVGRSLYTYTRVAFETGHFLFNPNELGDPKHLDKVPPEEAFIIVTGSQGEPRASLTRASMGDHPDIDIKPGDLVIFSSRIIPGNEKEILRVTNELTRKGARVLHEWNAEVHASGHATRDELMELLKQLRPNYFIPIHGEYRYLHHHAEIARSVVKAQSFVARNGDVIVVRKDGIYFEDSLDLEPFYVDGSVVGDAADIKLKERRKLLFNGIACIGCGIKRKRRGIEASVNVELVGIPDPDGSLERLITVVIQEVLASKPSGLSKNNIETEIRSLVRRLVRKKTDRRPIVHVSIFELGRE